MEDEVEVAYHRDWRESTFFNSISAEGSMLQLSLFGLLLFGCSLGIGPEIKRKLTHYREKLDWPFEVRLKFRQNQILFFV